jgi:hypothetical protein
MATKRLKVQDPKEWVCGVCGAGDFEDHKLGCSNDPTQGRGYCKRCTGEAKDGPHTCFVQ